MMMNKYYIALLLFITIIIFIQITNVTSFNYKTLNNNIYLHLHHHYKNHHHICSLSNNQRKIIRDSLFILYTATDGFSAFNYNSFESDHTMLNFINKELINIKLMNTNDMINELKTKYNVISIKTFKDRYDLEKLLAKYRTMEMIKNNNDTVQHHQSNKSSSSSSSSSSSIKDNGKYAYYLQIQLNKLNQLDMNMIFNEIHHRNITCNPLYDDRDNLEVLIAKHIISTGYDINYYNCQHDGTSSSNSSSSSIGSINFSGSSSSSSSSSSNGKDNINRDSDYMIISKVMNDIINTTNHVNDEIINTISSIVDNAKELTSTYSERIAYKYINNNYTYSSDEDNRGQVDVKSDNSIYDSRLAASTSTSTTVPSANTNTNSSSSSSLSSSVRQYVQDLNNLTSFDSIVLWSRTKWSRDIVLDILRYLDGNLVDDYITNYATFSELSVKLADYIMIDRNMNIDDNDDDDVINISNNNYINKIDYYSSHAYKSKLSPSSSSSSSSSLVKKKNKNVKNKHINNEFLIEHELFNSLHKSFNVLFLHSIVNIENYSSLFLKKIFHNLQNSHIIMNTSIIKNVINSCKLLLKMSNEMIINLAKWSGSNVLSTSETLSISIMYSLFNKKGIFNFLYVLFCIKIITTLFANNNHNDKNKNRSSRSSSA
jgi:hypothetical protein